jgi:glycosyltransferase involved in cell wall biosynthesis
MTAAICVDGYNLALPKGSGIATYARSTLSAISSLGLKREILHGPLGPAGKDALLNEVLAGDARWRLKTLTEPLSNRRIQAALARFGRTAHRVEPTGEVLWPGGTTPDSEAFWMSQDLYRIASRAFSDHRVFTPVRFSPSSKAPALMHWAQPTPLAAPGIANVYTLHDLIPLKAPHTTLDDKQRFLDLSRRAVARADHIVAVSETTRQDAIRLLGVDPAMITTTWQAFDLPADVLDQPASETADDLASVFGLDWGGYFLFFGAIEPKKNLGRLVEAWLRSRTSTPLVVVGARAWMSDPEVGLAEALIEEGLGAGKRLHRYDHLPRNLLMQLVRGARAVAFPSIYEGFGLPALEAMALGAPVLASTGGSLPEITGDAAILADPHDVDDIARAIRLLDSDHDLRRGLSERGLMRAQEFSPENYARRLGEVYRRMGVSL